MQNRVTEILNFSEPEHWKYIKGTDNPADLGTRGISLRATGSPTRDPDQPEPMYSKPSPGPAL